MSDASDENAKNSAEREDAAPDLAGAATVNRSGRKRGSRVQTYVVIGLLASAVGYVGYSMFKQSDLAPSVFRVAPMSMLRQPDSSRPIPNGISNRLMRLTSRARKRLIKAGAASSLRQTNRCAILTIFATSRRALPSPTSGGSCQRSSDAAG
ncbi:hypothetical protein HED50_23345 [Ochrobactrum oryzae]|nr:hypothetical protein [Brucella oryzae]